jgi:peptidoglycan/LPS O-acetylase OafA/YrhL
VNRGRIAFVDMLRGLAALIVLFHHAHLHFPETFACLPGWLQRVSAEISARNLEAVLLFFVLSGLSIRISVEMLDLRRPSDLNEYLYRRFKRILPLYLFSLAFAALCVLAARVPVEPRALSPLTLLGNLLFLQSSASVPGNWFVPFAGNGPLWSLSYEMFYYLLFPLQLRLMPNPRTRLAGALAISAAGLVLNRLWPNPLAAFASLYAVWYAGVEVAERLLGRTGAPGWLPPLAWVLMLVAGQVIASTTLSNLWFGMTLLLVGLAIARWRWLHALAAAPVVRGVISAFAWVGGFSYALYLLHFPLLRAVGTAVGTGPVPLLLAVAASCALAFVAERLSLRPRYLLLKRQYLR